ncbi:M14 family metallopeptidase [Collimonas sp.]|jgi:hypothetical protein|uniref:M14 family metallopeptidase n=1 Tax=Collimonas sp. TaxID=1963772 RepID=UPI002B8013DE|nr:M14 family metallopeptidase [Collimonas sp.]HWX04034.1 M14 family metallopeptidase [Collimonas sp.]
MSIVFPLLFPGARPARRAVSVCAVALLLAAALPPPANAQYDPAKVLVEIDAVASQYPDPDVVIESPAFAAGKTDFTSQQEMLAFVQKLAAQTPAMRVRQLGLSQQGRAIPLLAFAEPPSASGAELMKNGKPTVLLIGSQHGNEPAGGEAALAFASMLARGALGDILAHVNILIVPRANPDGSAAFLRGLADGRDVNRDHLMLATPEGQALAQVFNAYQPEVVLDSHEFSVGGRWVEKFGALQKYDGLIQFATVANLPPAQAAAAESLFRQPMLQEFDRRALSHSWYYTTSVSTDDKTVAMGGVGPDTGRNIAGLRNAFSFLLETRGVGIGKAHFKRRVYTHLTAIESIVRTTASQAPQVLALNRQLRQEVAVGAGQGVLNVIGVATPGRHTLAMLDAQSGQPKAIEVDWKSALEIQPRLQRPRPYAYLMPASEQRAAERLQTLGVSVYLVAERLQMAPEQGVQAYRLTSQSAGRKQDVTGSTGAAGDVIRVTTQLEPVPLTIAAGWYYVPLDQPLANLAAAALEPESQSSYVSNRLLQAPVAENGNPAYLPLYRLTTRPQLAVEALQARHGLQPGTATQRQLGAESNPGARQ